MQGEILTSGDPYTIPQKGFNHAWDAHGGDEPTAAEHGGAAAVRAARSRGRSP